jgi:hypothetical protein
MAENPNAMKTVELLVKVASLDTVYRDIYLDRARQFLSAMLDEPAYRAIGSSEKEINELTARSRSAVLQRDWQQAAELSARIARLREHIAAMGNLRKSGADVYEADAVAFEPFSPGKHLGANAPVNQPGLRSEALTELAALAKLDPGAGAFYEKRRTYFSGLELASAPGASKKGPTQRDRAQTERLAMEAADGGDVGALERLSKELRDWKETGPAAVSTGGASLLGRYECPVDLAAPFPPETVERAQPLGLVEAHTTPMAEFAKVREIIYTHIDQPVPSSADMEREGVLRARAQAEMHLPAELDTEEARVLAAQFLQQIFLNSGGARYLPLLGGDTALVEDFAENESADAPSELLAALGLRKRSGRSRAEIERALMGRGKDILDKDLGLDPAEFRLICIPYDLYTRFGRERGLGKWPHWTHFDGYQVMGGNRLRALAGGDGRFGGLYDLVSISPSDAREEVYARFAVVRRARMTLRWH